MRRILFFCVGGALGFAILSSVALAGGRNLADYPLRVHIFQFNGFSHYYRAGGGASSSLNDVDGEGRANLYENGQPRGVDFSYHCTERLMVSPGFETYPARWKKAGRELEILMPVLGGKPGEMNSCELKVAVKADSAYIRHNGLLSEEPASVFKEWMVKHEYDPEHGQNEPVNLNQPQPASAQPTGSSNTAQ